MYSNKSRHGSRDMRPFWERSRDATAERTRLRDLDMPLFGNMGEDMGRATNKALLASAEEETLKAARASPATSGSRSPEKTQAASGATRHDNQSSPQKPRESGRSSATEDRLRQRLKTAEQKIKQLEHDKGILAAQLQSNHTEEIDQLRRENEGFRSQIRSIQENAFNTMDSARWSLSDDEASTQRRISAVLDEIKQWSENYSYRQSISFSKVAKLIDSGAVETSKDLANFWTHIPPALFLQAVASMEAVDEILGNPFFIFQSSSDPEDLYTLRDSDADSLERILEMMEYDDLSAAWAWRSQLVRSFHRSDVPESLSGRSLSTIATAARTICSQRLANRCVRKASSVIPEGLTAEAQTALSAIFERCVDLSWRLHLQKTRVSIFKLAELLDEDEGHYYHGSKLVQPHDIHNKVLGSDPVSLDGCELALLISPAVVVRDIQDRRIILKNAVAWICSELLI